MSGHEPGDPNNYPVEVALVDDGTLPTAANVNLGLQDLADRTETIRVQGLMRLVKETFLVDGTWTKPADLASEIIMVEGCGGGGGGGCGGQSTTNAADRWNSGGAGGGGALLFRAHIDLTDLDVGEDVSIGIGAGGLGGVLLGDPGGDGNQSYLDCTALFPNTTFFFKGGAGGAPGRETTISGQPVTALGGPPLEGTRIVNFWQPPIEVGSVGTMMPLLQPGQGGHATTGNFPSFTFAGAISPTPAQMVGLDSGGAGGAKGTAGTASGSYRGGGPGAGGGGGPYGGGATGGSGGDGNNAGSGTSGTAGSNAAANSGAGGGGGAGAGYGSTAMGIHGQGGNGGSGRVTIYSWRKGRTLP